MQSLCECGGILPPSKPKGGPRKFCSRKCLARSTRQRWRSDPANRDRERAQRRVQYAADPKRAMGRTLAWRARNPEASKIAANRSRVKTMYGLTLEQYDRFVGEAERCPICSRYFSDVRPVLDHDHATGKLRGVLCDDCNRAIGMFHDDWQACFNAVQYLFGERSNLKSEVA